MLFNEFGKKGSPTILIMHGMLQDWHTEYEMLKPLEESFRIIIPAMDGMYPNSPKFTNFTDQCRQIENYIKNNYNGKIKGVFGSSQGGAVMTELLARNNIEIDTAVLDGVYLAHHGKSAAYCTYKMLKYYKDNRKFPKALNILMKLMGLGSNDYEIFETMYWNVTDISMKKNLYENFTYRANPNIKNSDTKIYLWCGSKERYALKSHKILKKYLQNFEEEIFEGYGHIQMLMQNQNEVCKKLIKIYKV